PRRRATAADRSRAAGGPDRPGPLVRGTHLGHVRRRAVGLPRRRGGTSMSRRSADAAVGSARRGPIRGRSAAVTARLAVLLRALTGQDVAPGGRRALEDQVVHALRDAGHEAIWLTLAVLTAALPEPADVVRSRRLAELNGPRAMIHAALAGTPRDRR